MSICINSNYSPMFKGKLPLNPKVSKVVGTIKSDNLTAIKAPIATMAALAGVAIVQGHKNITTEDIQAKNVALCEAEQVPLAPTVASILSSLEEPVIFEGQKILSQDVDITNVDFKPLINKLKETNANEKPLRISCNGVEYDVDYGIAKYNTSSYKLEEITITPVKENETSRNVYTLTFWKDKLSSLKKHTIVETIQCPDTFKQNNEKMLNIDVYKDEIIDFRDEKFISGINYGNSSREYKAKYFVEKDSGKITNIYKSIDYTTGLDWENRDYDDSIDDSLVEMLKEDFSNKELLEEMENGHI